MLGADAWCLGIYIASEALTESQAAKLFGVTQPRISNLVRGRIAPFGLDASANMVAAVGMHVEMYIA